MDDEIIPELTPYYVGPADSSSEDSSSFYDAFEEPPPPAYTPPKPPPEIDIQEEGVSIFRCYSCGHNITDSSTDYCLNCGLNIEGVHTNYKECTRCNSYYLSPCNCFFCTRCGNTLTPMSNEITCNCGCINKIDNISCWSCGFPLQYERYVELFKCPIHWGNSNTRYCYKCGVYLVPVDDTEPVQYAPGGDCVICLENRREVAFIPCGHRCICISCSKSYIGAICPLCRFPYKDILKIYL